jgi:predicted NAD/FAD-binding protein
MENGRTSSYFPCIKDLTTYAGNGRGKKVLVVGSGCSGLGSAWHLNRAGWDVTMKEADSRFGGHANTVSVDGTEVDTGFMVYNSLNYPNLIALFQELGVEGLDTEMGFSVSMDDGKFEWCGDSLSGLLATPSNAINPAFYAMMRDILRFNKEALKALALPDNHPTRLITTGTFLEQHKFSKSFTNLYLVPMTAAIWSASTDGILGFPAITLFSFLNNHLLLQVTGHINWMTPAGRSKQYVQKIVEELGSRAQSSRPVESITRSIHPATGLDLITAVETNGEVSTYDNVIFACHPDQALRLLSDASQFEKDVVGSFKYSPNDTYVHTDVDLMPKAKSAWTSWNYIGNSAAVGEEKPVFVTYWLNKLQKLNHPTDIFVSLNPSTPPAADKILKRMNYTHPQYTQESVAAQKRVVELQGNKGTYFCGAWMGFGFHEVCCCGYLYVITIIIAIIIF